MGIEVSGKRVTVAGLARSGRSAATLLKMMGASVFVSEHGQLRETAIEWLEERGFDYETGGHTEKALKAGLIVVSPGVRPESWIISEARQRMIPVIGEIELAYYATKAKIIAVTGTNGKSTTTSMIAHILNESGRRCLVGGNLAPGRPLCDLAAEAGKDDIIAAEVSSFQLETIVEFRPAVAVITNITPDHLDRHPDMGSYARAKGRILENQHDQDCAVINKDDPIIAEYCRPKGETLLFSGSSRVREGAWCDGKTLHLSRRGEDREIMLASALRVPGEHNIENALAAAAACSAFGLEPAEMGKALSSFTGVPHRLEEVATVDQVRYINNSMCTNPVAGASSLKAFDAPVVVIAGGRQKGLDMGPYVREIAGRARAAVLIGESRTDLEKGLSALRFREVHHAENLGQAVAKAAELARPGWVVLFSPGCSSFDMFRDFEERGLAFSDEVLKLKQV